MPSTIITNKLHISSPPPSFKEGAGGWSLRAAASILFLIISNLSSAQAYFQQEVNYKINVKLDDGNHQLFADETIVYKNNSPTPLTYIYMHLWANAYKDNNTCLAKQLVQNGKTEMYYANEEDFGYIDSIDFKVNNKRVKWELLKDSIDICKMYLEEPLQSGASITITTPFHVKIPSAKISRLGHIGQAYMITQWYPKPAVYDRNGWNYMPYLNQGEFYSEFGSYDVSITLPGNYVLGATGDMVDGEKEMEWLNKNAEQTKAITKFDNEDMDFPSSDYITKTLRFKQSNVHDFAWFADKRYHVLKGEVTTPHTNHKVTTWAMFTNANADLWTKGISYINDAIHYYSLWNGDYPYNNCTAVDGTISAGGGMEYPNITVINSPNDSLELDIVITHEVGHNWFYGMLGSNERAHAWMDEGINSYNELRYVQTKYPNAGLAQSIGGRQLEKLFHLKPYKQKQEYMLGYLITAKKNEDQPIELPAYNYSETNYGGDVYSKTAIVFDYLRAYLGDSLMDKAMQAYFAEWHYKHPMPEDFRKVMETTTGKDLKWFFDDLINSTKKLDYKIVSAKKNNDGSWNIGVKNCGSIRAPFFITAIKGKAIISTEAIDGFDGYKTIVFNDSIYRQFQQKIVDRIAYEKAHNVRFLGDEGNFYDVNPDKFKIDYKEVMPEINRNNNTIRTKGLFKKVEPISIQFLGSIDNPNKSQLFYTPVIGWNEYDKGMVGLAVYNNLFPEKQLEYQLMPMWSFAQKDLAGYGKVMWHLRSSNNSSDPNGNDVHLSVGVTATRYDYSNDPFSMNFNKIAPELLLETKKSNTANNGFLSFRYRYISIMQDFYKGDYEFTPPIYTRTTLNYTYNDLTLKMSTNDAVNPYSIITNFQNGNDFNKLSLTQTLSFKYKNKNKSFDIRLFAGTFIGTNKSTTNDYRFRLSGQTGYQDYLYDNIYLGRSETKGIMASQFTETDGGFKFFSPVGQTNKWLVALNLKSSLGNAKIPINLYADIGTTEYDGRVIENVLYDAGICLSIRKKIFEIYFPLLICDDFKNYVKANDIKYQETIRFTLNINLLNPFDLIKDFKL